jgi:hypothetical protein
METKSTEWPGHTDEGHPEIFNTVPPLTKPLKPGQLSEEKLKQFFKDGYLVIESFFTPEELDPAKEAVKQLVEDLADKLYKAGKIKSMYSEYGLNDRLIMLENDFPGANIILHKLGRLPQALRNVWSNERALNLAEQILGTPDIAGHPVWNLRTKTPNNEATTVPWHQDVAYLDQGSYKIFQLTAWIPLLDATPENGCMQVIKSGHKTGKVADHQCCHGGTWYVMMVEDDIKKKLECDVERDTVTCPIPYGGMLILNNMTPHRSLNNMSNMVRWSLDFRWQAAEHDSCFHGLKQCIRMRSSTDPNLVIDFDSFDSVDRHKKALEELGQEEDEFDTTIQGPFMRNWEIVHLNRHNSNLPPVGTNWHNAPIVG